MTVLTGTQLMAGQDFLLEAGPEEPEALLEFTFSERSAGWDIYMSVLCGDVWVWLMQCGGRV